MEEGAPVWREKMNPEGGGQDVTLSDVQADVEGSPIQTKGHWKRPREIGSLSLVFQRQ